MEMPYHWRQHVTYEHRKDSSWCLTRSSTLTDWYLQYWTIPEERHNYQYPPATSPVICNGISSHVQLKAGKAGQSPDTVWSQSLFTMMASVSSQHTHGVPDSEASGREACRQGSQCVSRSACLRQQLLSLDPLSWCSQGSWELSSGQRAGCHDSLHCSSGLQRARLLQTHHHVWSELFIDRIDNGCLCLCGLQTQRLCSELSV